MDLDNKVHENTEENGDKIEPGELLEERWFFGNFLDRKQRMLRSFSDPCTSSNYSNHESLHGKSYEETYESIKKLSESETGRSNLMRTPSMPPSLDMKKDRDSMAKEKRKSKKKTLSNNLMRTPSLPTSLEEFHDEETEFSMGKLIRQASMKNSDTLPPRTQTSSKGVTPNSGLSRHRSRTRQELEPIRMEGLDEMKPRRITTKLKSQKSFNDLESEELKGFKDLGINPNRRELNRATSLVPSLPEKKRIEENDESNTRRRLHSSAPPVPKWGGKRSTEDVKAQIKFWARAVASNVRQEC